MSKVAIRSGLVQAVTPSQRTELYQADSIGGEAVSENIQEANADIDTLRGLDETAGAYAGATPYVVGDQVTSGGLYYKCIQNTTGNAPPNATYWQLIGSHYDGNAAAGVYEADLTLDGGLT